MIPFANVREELPIGSVLRPFQRFFSIQASGGIVLLVATLAALVWANSPWAPSYASSWQTLAGVSIDGVGISKPVSFWINDGLMTIFFFVVGLEIKRELLVGELAHWRYAILPVAGALGGMVVPAAVYTAFNAGTVSADGWGIPMATDTAFALGILALLGDRIPITLRIFVTALAIIDDVGALLVIALFYSADLSLPSLAIGGVVLAILAGASYVGVRHIAVYSVLGVGLWLAFQRSGIHPTIVGVLLAMVIPSWSRIGTSAFLAEARTILNQFESAGAEQETALTNAARQAALLDLKYSAEQAETPLQRLEHWLEPWATYLILPIFALANAGVSLGGAFAAGLIQPVVLGIVAGLALGKPLGITALVWLAVRSGLATLPSGLGWRHIWGTGWLCGIGFTMSLFITNLAFGDTPLLTIAKAAILAGSLISGLIGWSILRGIAGGAHRRR